MFSLVEIKAALESAIVAGGPLHVAAFTAWILSDSIVLRTLIDEASGLQGQSFLPDHVAVLGYGMAAGLLTPQETARLEEELTHLSGRTFFAPNRAHRFEIDGVALLGVSLAASKNKEDHSWLYELLKRSSGEVAGDEWQSGLVSGARATLGEMNVQISPPDLAAGLALKQVGLASGEDLKAGVELAMMLNTHNSGSERDAIRLAVFNAALAKQAQISFGSASKADLVTILGNLPKSLRLWRYEIAPRTPNSAIARWDIENEYHVQALLWVVLAPLFEDIEEEENLPSFGQKKPRADLVIPSLKTIIEVKFIRSTGQPAWAKVLDEVAADTALYLSNSKDYDNIIAFVWDDTAHTEQHGELKGGLEKLNGVSAAIVVSRPGIMFRNMPALVKPKRRLSKTR